MNRKTRVILASASPRRAQLLAEMGYTFDVVPPNVDESVRPGADPVDEAIRLAAAKAEDVAARAGPAVIIAADTIVALEARILGKPRGRAHAADMLRTLSGSRHVVITGVCVIDTRSAERITESVGTTVTMKQMSEEEIRQYVDSGEADGKAGAYAIQETADRYVLKVEGSFTNVVGLPTERLREILAALRVQSRGQSRTRARQPFTPPRPSRTPPPRPRVPSAPHGRPRPPARPRPPPTPKHPAAPREPDTPAPD